MNYVSYIPVKQLEDLGFKFVQANILDKSKRRNPMTLKINSKKLKIIIWI